MRPTSAARAAAAWAALLLAATGCDSATDSAANFVPTNPYDPLFEGTRIATAPSDLTLVPSAGTSVTIRWTDRSSFETGFRIERGASLLSSQFSLAARVAANTTEFTETGVTDSQERQYRIVAAADGETISVPSAILRVRRRQRVQTVLAVGPSVSRAVFTLDGERVYAFSSGNATALSTQTGLPEGTLFGAIAPVGVLTGGRLAALSSTTPTAVSVGIYGGTALERTVTLAPAGAPCPQIVAGSVVVSADAQVFAALCSAPGADSRSVAVWGASGGAPSRVVTAAGVRALVLALSPVGRRLVVSAVSATGGRELSAHDAATGAALWSTRDVRAADAPLRFSPNGERLFDGATGLLRLLASATGGVLAQQSDPPDRVQDIVFSPDGESVAVVTTSTATVTVLRTSTLAQTYRLRETRTTGVQLLGSGVVIGFRGTTSGAVAYDVVRWDPQAEWEVVPES